MRELQQEMQRLLKSPGWAKVVEIGEMWIAQRKEKTDRPILTMEGAAERNIDVGMTKGMQAILHMPETLIESLNPVIAALIEEQRDARDFEPTEGHPSD